MKLKEIATRAKEHLIDIFAIVFLYAMFFIFLSVIAILIVERNKGLILW